MVIALLGWIGWRSFNAYRETARESALLNILHRGESRYDFYAKARSIKLTPIVTGYVRHDPRGPTVDITPFPEPSPDNPHPTVYLTFEKLGGIYSWKADRVEIVFDKRDRVANWTIDTYETGA